MLQYRPLHEGEASFDRPLRTIDQDKDCSRRGSRYPSQLKMPSWTLFSHFSARCLKPVRLAVTGGQLVLSKSLFGKAGNTVAATLHRNGLPMTRKIHRDYRLVYEGPLSNTVRYIKTFSLATCVASLIGTPILVMYGRDSIPKAGKIAVAATVLLMGTSTTFILHWFTRVYVHRMYYNPIKSSFAVETMNIIARRRTTYFPVDHIQYPLSERAFSTFSAEGNKYFLHMELKEAELAMGYVKERNLAEMQK